MILILILYAVLAITFPIAKQALSYASPYFLVAFRLIISGIVFLVFQYCFDKKHFILRKNDILLFVKTTFFYTYLAFVPEYWALQRLTSTKVVIIYSFIPFVTAVCAYFFVKEQFTKTKVVGMAVGLLGMIPLLMTPDHAGSTTKELFTVSTAEAVLLIAVVALAYGWFPAKKLMSRGYSIQMINGCN